MHAQDAIYEHLIHNILFPNTRYHLEGISEDADGVRIVLSQKYIPDIFSSSLYFFFVVLIDSRPKTIEQFLDHWSHYANH